MGDIMNLMQLKYFSTVCETGTVSAASEILHISQPSLSNAIKEMETEFGVKLFFRKHR
jgi:DNA-binding transcriptional LysR family regulator